MDIVCRPGSQQILKLTIFVGYEYDLDEESNDLVMTNKKTYVILNADVFTQMHEDIIPRAPFVIKWKVQENSFSEDFPDEIECTWHSLHKSSFARELTLSHSAFEAGINDTSMYRLETSRRARFS